MGEWSNKIEGKLEEVKGKVTNNKSDQVKGKAKQSWGDLEGHAKDLKRTVADNRTESSARTADGTVDDTV